MSDGTRVVTTALDHELMARLDQAAKGHDRSKSWIMRQALKEWLAEDRRRYELTLDALNEVDQGRLIDQREIDRRVQERTAARAASRGSG